MEKIYNEIKNLLASGLGSELGFDSNKITYEKKDDQARSVLVNKSVYNVGGVRETIYIPDEYMQKAGANSAAEFLAWLKNQAR